MSGFEKDTVYYRANTKFRCGVETSGYLGEDNIDAEKLAIELKLFLDGDGKSFEIAKHCAKKGDALAHTEKIIIKLVRKNKQVYVEE